jgi:hypothetical protein
MDKPDISEMFYKRVPRYECLHGWRREWGGECPSCRPSQPKKKMKLVTRNNYDKHKEET